MTHYTPLTAGRQNECALALGKTIQAMSDAEFGEYSSYQMLVDVADAINGTRLTELQNLKDSLFRTHGIPAIGAFGNIINVALAQSVGAEAHVVARDGDLFVDVEGNRGESKTSIRNVTPAHLAARRQQMMMNFTGSQLRKDAPDWFAWSGYDIVGKHTARLSFVHGPVRDIAELVKGSRQRGKLTLSVPINARTGLLSTRGAVGKKLAPLAKPDIFTYRYSLVKG